ncbi:glycoside hydrolase family 3 N-terminal domain-containing protein [Sporolactobacillus pectinivorans]|uniref:glycoside hydrolase family 3 N-terminal domain-containing protein n=1 Tax=Sporolactobacillus pectinivorans TaxID=1591408 RepID=UPI001EFCF6B1|nr:glycoside hydrolase family 3 N-terminal domain-containing protein [Sporolactobacillus pectinivorans]
MKEHQLRVLLEKLSLKEKVGQLVQLVSNFYPDLDGKVTGPMVEMGVTDELVANSGSVLGASGARQIKKMLRKQLEKNRHHIPLLVMADVIHGYKTIFPIPLAMGCSWDPVLVEKAAEISAREASVSGVHVVFAPMVDLVRDPRWGRVMESTGEDPYLNSVFAKAFVNGFQGKDLKNDLNRTAACVKHFAGYGAVEGGREYNTVNMSERQMRQDYLPSYKSALDAGCRLIMTSYNIVDGIPASANQWLLRRVLRDEWKFDGVVISDRDAVRELIPHGVAEDEKEAALKAVKAGVDIEMMTLCYTHHLAELIDEKRIPESLLDEAAWRILKLKNDLGLFENPFRGADEDREKELVYCPAHRNMERKIAEQSCVLLKNNGTLPLKKKQKLAIIGPFSNSGDILGAWSWRGDPNATESLSGAFKSEDDFEISSARGSGILERRPELLNEAVETANAADLLILAVGESPQMSGEASSRADIRLPTCQLELIRELKKQHKPMVGVLFNGRPLDLTAWIDDIDALLEVWYPGSDGARAVANLLTGKANPSGKLSMSFPRTVGQIPVYYNHYNTGRPPSENPNTKKYVSKYIDCPNDPLFPFGFGLSYTNFGYSGLTLSSEKVTDSVSIDVSVDVSNTGTFTGSEVVQLYIRDVTGEVVRPLKELKMFKKIVLRPGECQTVRFTIDEPMLRYYHSDLSYRSDEGSFEVLVGGDSVRTLNKPFKLRKVWGADS